MLRLCAILGASLFLAVYSTCAHAGGINAFDPSKTWIFAVGVLKFKDAETTSWDTKNRRDEQIVELLRSRGVPSDRIAYISDARAMQDRLQTDFNALLRQTSPGDLLIFYYTGHGSDGSFETYDGQWWDMKAIVNSIEREFKGSDVLLIGDCCNSGSLASSINRTSGSIGYAVLSSSAANEEGHGNWTCSQAILEGLEGYPVADTNKDGVITVQEIADYLKKEIAVYEENHSIFKTAGGFNPTMVMAKTLPGNAVEPEPVEVFYNQDWWKGKLLERREGKGHIRWIQLGYDSPDQDEWVDLKDIRPLKPGSRAD